jgi:NADPH:quinone reductase-like Zn-dependent oxidoreductase
VRAASGGKVDAFADTFGDNYVKLALDLGVAPARINTIINFVDASRYGTKTAGNADAANAEVFAQLANMIERGLLEVPITTVFPLEQVQDAYRELEKRNTRGKIVLKP